MENQEAESGAKMGESGERIRISEQKRNLPGKGNLVRGRIARILV